MTEINEFKGETSVISNRRHEGICENASSLSQSSENSNGRYILSKGKKAKFVEVEVLGKVRFVWNVEFCDEYHPYFAAIALTLATMH